MEENFEKVLVPQAGLEPARPCGQQILSLSRLPFRHWGQAAGTWGKACVRSTLGGVLIAISADELADPPAAGPLRPPEARDGRRAMS